MKLIGADISYLEKDGFPPIKIKGKKLNFKKVQISSNVSSQFVSAILLVAPKLIGGLAIELKGELISKPYIEMTLSLLNDLGIKTSFKGKLITVKNLEKIQDFLYKTLKKEQLSQDYFVEIYYFIDCKYC